MAWTEIDIEIKDDGKVCMTTGDISQQLHLDADELLAEVEATLGGPAERKRREHPFWAKRSVGLHGKITRTA